MKSLKRSLAAVASGAVLLASVGLAVPANAAGSRPSEDPVQTVEKITAKAPGVLHQDAVVSKDRVVVGTAKVRGEAEPLVAVVAADDAENSVVASAGQSQSVITVLDKGKSSADFSMKLPDGFVAEMTGDGGVQLRNRSTHVILPFIKAPWALDANGKKLPTSYTIKGSKITQHVNTDGAAYPVIADPSIQWIPYPVVAMWGWQADQIAKFTATFVALGVGGTCTTAVVAGWIGKIFSGVCSLIGWSSARDLFISIGKVWRSGTGLATTTCYGFKIWNPGDRPVTMPARDCA